MESYRDTRLPVTVALILVAAAAVHGQAWAEDQPRPDRTKRQMTAVVHTTSDSTVVESTRTTETSGSPGENIESEPVSSKKGTSGSKKSSRPASKKAGRSGSKPKCRSERSTMGSVGEDAEGVKGPYDVYCSGEYKGTVFILDSDPPPSRPRAQTSPEPAASLSERIREEYPLPTGTIRINPGLGLVGTESWFWLDGVNGDPTTQTTDAFGTPVHVESQVTSYRWSFGDGSSMQATSPGKPYPQRSDINHIFQRASSDYPVEVHFGYAVRYSTDGVNWTPLPEVNRTASARYSVRESQAVISK